MNFTNLANTFTIFGNFAVFDEESIALINNLYAHANINIMDENNPEQRRLNKSGRLMQIINKEKHETIILRPNRIDIQLPGIQDDKKEVVLKEVEDTFNILIQIFEASFASRIAYVGSFFTFDDEGTNMQIFSSRLDFLNYNSTPKELSIRTNNIENIENEDTNIVFNLNNILISPNTASAVKRRAIMVTFDINTVPNEIMERFNLNELIDEVYQLKTYDIDYFED